MRGTDIQQSAMFSYLSPEQRVPASHPLRAIRQITDGILRQLSKHFSRMYARVGRPSIPPERLLRALLLQIFYTVRSERLLMEQLDYNLLFRWFVGMDLDEAVWRHAVFSKNRERLLNEEVARVFFEKVLERAKPYLSDEHFTVDGTLMGAWASQKSFRPQGEGMPQENSRGMDFHGERRSNQTHQSRTDPDARLYKKSQGSEAKLAYLGHVLMENRNGLLVDSVITQADGTAERDAALQMASRIAGVKPVTLGADKNYDTRELVRALRERAVTPHVVQNNTRRSSAIDGRTRRHSGHAISQRKRKRVEESFGWMKIIGLLKKVKLRGLEKVSWLFTYVAAAYNLCRLRGLQARAG